jgi:hypothetical protein
MGKTKMSFGQARALLDEVNEVIATYDPVLKEKARDILLEALFGAQIRASLRTDGSETEAGGSVEAALVRGDHHRAEDFPALLHRWHPPRASEKTLLAAYYLKKAGHHDPLTSQRINTVLKQHGLSVSNITRAIETNLRASPPLMEQLRKRGPTRQARKEYQLTEAGERMVVDRLSVAG